MRAGLPFIVAGLVVILDRITKIAIEQSVSMWDTHVIIPGVLNIVHTRNRGAAFGMFSNAPDGVRELLLIGVSIGVMAMIGWMLWQSIRGATPSSSILRVALALVLGGAMGNLYDRLARGSVTDFIQVFLGSYEWPSFNVADSAITVGAILLGIDMLMARRTPAQTSGAA